MESHCTGEESLFDPKFTGETLVERRKLVV